MLISNLTKGSKMLFSGAEKKMNLSFFSSSRLLFSSYLKSPVFSQRNFSSKSDSIESVKDLDLKKSSRNLLELLHEEIDGIEVIDNADIKSFLEERNYQVEIKDEMVHLRKTIGNYSMHISFELPDDEVDTSTLDAANTLNDVKAIGEEKENEENEEKEVKEGEEGENEENEENEEKTNEDRMDRSVSLQLIVESTKGTRLISECAVAKDGNLYIENIRFSEESKRLWFSDLSDTLQERLFDWMDAMGLDSDLGNFILEYIADYRSRNALATLGSFKQLVLDGFPGLEKSIPKPQLESKSQH